VRLTVVTPEEAERARREAQRAAASAVVGHYPLRTG
jgi:hypothetical protein